MGNKHNHSQDEDSASLRKILGVFNLVGKIGLTLAIFYGVIFCLGLFVDGRPSPQKPSATVPEQTTSEWDMQNQLHGNWIFADLPWSIQTQKLSQLEATELFKKAVPKWTTVDSPNQDSSDLGILSELLVGFNAQPQTRGGNTLYQVQTGPIQVVAFAPIQDPSQIQIVRVLQDAGDGMLNYFELNVSSQIVHSEDLAEKQLLPMHPTARRLAVRLDTDNEICGELYELAESLDFATEHWIGNGWKVQILSSLLSETGETIQQPNVSREVPPDSRDPSQDVQPLACSRGSELVVVVPLPSVSKETFLFLMRP